MKKIVMILVVLSISSLSFAVPETWNSNGRTERDCHIIKREHPYSVPEPTTASMLVFGLLIVAGAAFRSRKK
jgi:hypothetical protein